MRHVACLALAMAVLAGCAGERGHVYRVPSSAMEPTLHCAKPGFGCEADEEDRIFAVPYEGDEPKRGDIVVFETPERARLECGAGGLYVKRVIGLPGERWRVRSGHVLIDGNELAEPWLRPERRDGMSFRGGQLRPGQFLMLGDNRASSCDSRIFGPVPSGNIRGKVVEIKRGSKRIHLR